MPETTAPAPSNRVARLLDDPPESWSLPRLWSAMPLALRREVVTVVLEDPGHAELHEPLHRAIARAAGFRHRILAGMPPATVARFVGKLPSRNLPAPADVLRAFLITARPDMLGAYLDHLGVPHEAGRVDDDHDEPIEPGRTRAAAEALLERFPTDEVVVYLQTLHVTATPLAEGIPEWLHTRFSGAPGVPDPDDPDDAARPADEDPEAREPELVAEARRAVPEEGGVPGGPFTALDRTLIRAAVDCAQGVIGAPDPAMIEDMIEEVLELNSERHRSYFHRGFVDALLELAYRDTLPAENEPRRSWYMTGWISGLARAGRNPEIAELLDASRHTRTLLHPGSEWAVLALPIVFRALCRVGREPEAARRVPAGYLLGYPTLLPELLEEGTRLLREDDAERARPLFDRLGKVVEKLESLGEPVTERFFLEVRRRRAHCYRQLGEMERARELLERLLREEGDNDIQAMVLADLGLLDAGFRALAEVRLWRSESERADIVEALERGRDRFEAAARTGSRFASHGQWPLAVLALGGGDPERARELLSGAISSFLERPERYAERHFLARVRVAYGIAEALVMEYTRLPRARELLVRGIAEGARVPDTLLSQVLAVLDAHEEDLAGEVLTRILEQEGPGVLDRLGDSGIVRRTPAVADHLLAHAEAPGVGGSARAQDLYRALPVLLADRAGDRDRARQVLDQLEELALEGVGRDRFLALLDEGGEALELWKPEEAAWSRITLLEKESRFDDVIAELRRRLDELLGGQGAEVEPEAEALLAQARSYGLEREWFEDMETRFRAWKKEHGEGEPEPLAPTHPNQPYRILIVGGDERQHDLKQHVQARLAGEGASIRVEHIPTGWSGNWAGTLERALAASERSDAVVLLRFMRTEFGRSLRAGLNCPWVSCPGVGRQQVALMVRKAARFAAGGRVQ